MLLFYCKLRIVEGYFIYDFDISYSFGLVVSFEGYYTGLWAYVVLPYDDMLVDVLFYVLDVLLTYVLFCLAFNYTIFNYKLMTLSLISSSYFSHFSTLYF